VTRYYQTYSSSNFDARGWKELYWRKQPDGSWDEGWIYDPKVGRSYNVDISLISDDRLQVWGYLGMKMFGRKIIWQRAEADLPSCEAST